MRSLHYWLVCHILLLLLAMPAYCIWSLWPSPYDNTETPDQAQTVDASGYVTMNGYGIGQTFIPRATPLTRIDVKVKNRTDERPGVMKLWKWNTNYATTVAQPPLFQDVVDLTGIDIYQLRSFYPELPVEVGSLYYMEFNRNPGVAFYLAGSNTTTDYYPDGKLRVNNAERATWDLWFKTYTTPQGVPAPPPFTGSDPALPWTAPAVPGPAVTKADYLTTVKSYMDSIRSSVLNGDGHYAHVAAIYEAFLYKATGNPTYAAGVAAILRKSNTWRAAHPTEEVGFGWMESPGIAYLQVRDSTALTADDHAVIKALLLDSARKFWPIRETGVMNRAIGGALTFQIATQIFTAGELNAGEWQQWRDYQQAIWDDFWHGRDTEEDSCHYNWLGWRLLLEYITVSGLDNTVWADAQFRTLVERSYRVMTPLGVTSGYGDSLGWGVEWCCPVWLFSKAAAKWREPKFQWMAYRAFDYHRTHVQATPWQAFYEEMPALCFAYFDADDTLAAVPPSAQGELLAARQDGNDGMRWLMSKANRIGQTFVPSETPLVRLDLKGLSIGANCAGTVKLWKWAGTYAATVAAAPLYRDQLEFVGGAPRVLSMYPFLGVEVGATYYLEVTVAGGAIELRGSHPKASDYAGGTLWSNGNARPTVDLWFRTYTLTRENASMVTMRHEFVRRAVDDPRVPYQWFDWGTGMVPDKLVLNSGSGPDGFHAVFNLMNSYGHGHVSPGALSVLTDHGAVILHENDYRDGAQDQDEMLTLTRRYAGGTQGAVADRVAVDHFTDYRKAAVAWLAWGDPHGWDVTHHRRVYFIKDRFLLVRDNPVISEGMRAATGVVWHATDVHPDHGDNWYDVYMRVPKGLNWTFKNPQRAALLYFVPHTGYDVAAWKETSYNTGYTSSPYVLYQRWKSDLLPINSGEQHWFDTLLLPHGPELTPTAAAGKVSVLYNDGVSVALRVVVGDETWTVIDNPAGARLVAPGLTTDAVYAIVRTKPNTPDYLLAYRATVVNTGGVAKTWNARVDGVEIGGY